MKVVFRVVVCGTGLHMFENKLEGNEAVEQVPLKVHGLISQNGVFLFR